MIAILLSALAFADAIDMPPDDCVYGATGESSHEGTWCEARTCSSPEHCRDGQECLPDLGLCVVPRTVPCGGRRPDYDTPCSYVQNVAVATCTSQADCAEGTCVIADRCATPTVLGSLGCGGCATAPGGAAILGLVVLGLLIPRARPA